MIAFADADCLRLTGLVHSVDFTRTDADGPEHVVLVDVSPNGSGLLGVDDLVALRDWIDRVLLGLPSAR